MLKKLLLFALLFSGAVYLNSCQKSDSTQNTTLSEYFKDSTSGVKTGGIQIVSINTPNGKFNVWTKRIGNNPGIKLLVLNGGPGGTHEYFECMESFLPAEGIELIYYDQLGCGNSDNPNDTTFWQLPRFVEEVEQVRQALKLDNTNFYLLGHSWGGILAMEYSLKYQQHIKGLIISNMMSSCPEYGKYADSVLAPQFDPKVLARIKEIEAKKDFSNPEYMELLMPNFYTKHICRMPLDQWPEPVNRTFSKMNNSLYVTMQGPSEFGIGGNLANWDRKAQLKNISIPTLVIGAKHDTMDPNHMQWMSTQVQNGSYLFCPNGSHMAMYDDQQTYMAGLIKFLKGTNDGKKKVVL
ncbi:proline iminopeptidase-family hydrolase [Emticicia sp. BO119]|uniref:proline iminopeptidase-family hydrolase n=1 Tax=Emticicia sp. BO119 TaxID=2757768 RepID=UPI0015F04B84|nr:proline iminopeptidase-family hydrolase [Emticicia sp. BO119]MBA4849581.1 proline iminopeptidase-family hydrolase [Emticicia sp. BO119]